MAREHRGGPVDSLRNLALSLERLAASGAVSGAVRGAADGLREQMPELDGQLRALLHDALTALGRLAREAAEREREEPGATAQALAAATVQGALEVLEREWQDGGMPLHGFTERLNHLLDEVIEYAHSRTDEIRTPTERAQALVRGLVREAAEQLHHAAPALAQDASKAGRSLVEGATAGWREDSSAFEEGLERAGRSLARGLVTGLLEDGGVLRRASQELTGGALETLRSGLRRPLMAIAGAGGVLFLSMLAVRWRSA